MSEFQKGQSVADPLIVEVRTAREKLCARFSNDIEKLCAHLREIEEQQKVRLVKEMPRVVAARRISQDRGT